MLFNKQIKNIIINFFNENKTNIILIFLISNVSFFIDSIILPSILSSTISNLNDKILLKNNILKIIFGYILSQSFYGKYDEYYANIDPLFEKYLTDIIIFNLFKKYENTNIKNETSIIFNKITQLKRNLIWVVNKLSFYILPRLISLFIAFIKMLYINKEIAYSTLGIVILQIYLSINQIDKCIDLSYDEINKKDNNMSIIEDKFYNIDTINNTYNGINKEINFSKKLSEESKKITLNSIKCVHKKQSISYTINSFSYMYIILQALKKYEKDEINGEKFIDIILTTNQLFSQITDICYFIPEIISTFGILQNNEEFIDDLFKYNPNDGTNKNVNFNSIAINNISFKYNDKLILNNLSKNIKSNTITAIFGKSGSGKSTLVKLICNILKPTSGSIFIDNVNINDIPKDLIKKNIFFINQESNKLFNETILYNMCYGMDNCNIDKIKSILVDYKLLNVFYNINKNNNQLNFLNFNVGKGGEYLSGGQKQLIHLIRSILYNKSKVLILDEPTSALDIETRNSVLKLIKDHSQDKIVIIITHDVYVRDFCNDIITME